MKLTVSGPSQAPAQLGAQALPAGHHVTAMARPPESVTTSHPGLPPHAAPPHCPAPPPNSLRRVKLDLPGAVTVTGYLLAVIYAVIEKSLPPAVAGVLLLAAFWVIELRSPAPLAPVRILRRPTVKVRQLRGAGGAGHGDCHDLPDDALPAADPALVPAGDRAD